MAHYSGEMIATNVECYVVVLKSWKNYLWGGHNLKPLQKWALVIILNLWAWWLGAEILCALLNSVAR